MEKRKLLIFPAGTEIAFEIFNALKYSKFVEIYGGTSADDHSEFTYKRLIKGFPYIDDPNFLAYLNNVIDRYGIQYVYPAHDSASVILSRYQADVHAEVIITDYDTTNACRSKDETYKRLAEYDFIPKVYNPNDDIRDYPVFIKPCVGQGSNGAQLIHCQEELKTALKENKRILICEYLPGQEYTVDCFTDRKGNLLVSKFRDRERIRNGIAIRSKSIPCPEEVRKIAEEINSNFVFKGAWFFQIKKDCNQKYKLLEISPRIPGTMGLSRNCGINFPLLTLFTFWGYDVSIIDNSYDITVDRAFYSAYQVAIEYEHIYIDFDDTIVLGDAVNPDIMRFLYQAANKEKKIHLLSKHKGNIDSDLKKMHIDKSLFSSVAVISQNDEKYNYITEKNAIFIDDSFAERKKVKEYAGIPVFDVDMIESLIDWRM